MGTQQTNDDGALGLPLVALGSDSTRRLAVIRDEQRMADVFAECAKAVAALRGGVEMLDEVANGMKDQPRFRTSLLMEAAADSLEAAISRANGGGV